MNVDRTLTQGQRQSRWRGRADGGAEEADGETERQILRQADRQRRQIEIQAGRQMEEPTDTQRDRWVAPAAESVASGAGGLGGLVA